jgi:hypothetical protein
VITDGIRIKHEQLVRKIQLQAEEDEEVHIIVVNEKCLLML